MPGICGLFDLFRADGPALDDMAAPLRPHDWFSTETCEKFPGVSLAAVALSRQGSQPHLAASNELVCVLDGEFYNADELKREWLVACDGIGGARLNLTDASDAALLLAGWRHGGRDFLRSLIGSFSAVLWDQQRKTATLVSDRFGNRPLYYAVASRRLIVGSRMGSLVADPTLSRVVNARGLAQFFSFGHYLGTDTSLDAVQVLPAGACWSWNAQTGDWTRDAYYSWEEAYRLGPMGRSEWIERIGTALNDSVKRQTKHTANLGLSLSGGLDGRTILACVDHEDTPVRTVCSGIRGSLDHRCAEQLAHLVRCRHATHELDTAFLGDYRRHLDQMVALTDGQYLSQCIVLPSLPLYRELGIEVLMRGHAGELMHMYKAYNYSLNEQSLAIDSLDGLESYLFRRLRAFLLDGVERPIFKKDLWHSLEGLARESLHADVAASADVDPPPQRIWQLFVTQRLRRETVLSMNKFRSVVETRLPLLDNELVALLLAAPCDLKLGEDLQHAILRRYRPEFLGVVNANTGTRVGAGPLRRKFSSLALRAKAKLGLPGYQPYERLGLWLRRELRPLVQQILLDPVSLDRGLYDPDGIRQVVRGHLDERKNHTYLLMALMIFELGLRRLQGQTTTTAGTSGRLKGAACP